MLLVVAEDAGDTVAAALNLIGRCGRVCSRSTACTELCTRVLMLQSPFSSAGAPRTHHALAHSHCLFGRNWGCTPDKEYKHLHFEVG